MNMTSLQLCYLTLEWLVSTGSRQPCKIWIWHVGSFQKSTEIDDISLSLSPILLKSTFYIVHFTARKCSDVCARSLAFLTISDWECHIMMWIVQFNSPPAPPTSTDQRNPRLSMTRVYHCISISLSTTPSSSACIFENHSSQQGSVCLGLGVWVLGLGRILECNKAEHKIFL